MSLEESLNRILKNKELSKELSDAKSREAFDAAQVSFFFLVEQLKKGGKFDSGKALYFIETLQEELKVLDEKLRDVENV